jgi:hypothetical protein
MWLALKILHKGLCSGVLLLAFAGSAFTQTPATKALGTVKSVSGNIIVLTPDAGADISVSIADNARILRTQPGQTDLKSATPISFPDLHVGDRLLARGQSGDNGAIVASTIIVISKGDIAQRQQKDQAEWRRGIGGIVKSVDSAAGTVTIVNSMLASGKPIVVHVTQQTQILRYATNSVEFENARPGTLDQINSGDQLRARGTKNDDGTEFNAQAILSGSFRQIAATVISTDPSSKSVSLMDLTTKKPITVRVGSDTDLHKLEITQAQRLAFFVKGGMPGQSGAATSGDPPSNAGAPANAASASWSGRGRGGSNGQPREQVSADGTRSGSNGTSGAWRSGGTPDLQQILSRAPAVTISVLNKGDAVILLEGSVDGQPLAIRMYAGVEPILSAAPPGTSAVMLLSPWNLGGGAGAGGDVSAP